LPLQFVEKCLVQASNFTFVSSSLPKTIFFMKYYLNWWRKQKSIWFTKIGRLYIFNKKFWLMNVQGGTCYFYFCDLNFLNLINNLIKWILGCLNQQKLLV
jgi:hypothetical protein